MKKCISFIAFIVLLSTLLTSCSLFTHEITPGSDVTLQIQSENFTCPLGDSVSLSVKDNHGNILTSQDILWNSSNHSIVSVDENGTVLAKDEGLAIITAIYKSDLSVTASVEVFVPYTVTLPEESAIEPHDQLIGDDFSGLEKFTKKHTKTILKSALSSAIPTKLFLQFFSKDVYLFSMFKHKATAKNVVIYSFCDWTNGNVFINPNQINAEHMYTAFLTGLNITESIRGKSFEDSLSSVISAVSGNIPQDGIYHFQNMDSTYQYRVVVRADFDYLKSMEYYSNGVLTGLGLTISDLVKKNFESITNNYTYQEYVDDILNLTNAHLCVEFRKRPTQQGEST